MDNIPVQGGPFRKNDPRINRSGRPRNEQSITVALREYLESDLDGKTRRQRLIEKLFSQAMEGDIQAQKYIIDRVDGKPKEQMTIDSESAFEHKIIIERIDKSN